MRITRGRFINKRLITPKTNITRPTSEKIRQAIFNKLEHNADFSALEGALVLDIFCGTGALGLEALSRGAKHITFLDNNYEAYKNLCDSCSQWGVRKEVTLLLKAFDAIPSTPTPMDFIFCDPPYYKNLIPSVLEILSQKGWIGDKTAIILELERKEVLEISENFEILEEKEYGDTKIMYIKNKPSS
jgi:16S rRNA (guanine966-N2)-methyltransferase